MQVGNLKIGGVDVLAVDVQDLSHSVKRMGLIYYVDAAQSDDTGDGLSIDAAKKTIGAAIALLSPGDNIVVKSGAYTETGLNLNIASTSINFELGVTLTPASGTAFIISGNYCGMYGHVVITPAAGQIGVLGTGTFFYCKGPRVADGGQAFDIQGTGSVLRYCRAGDPTICGFKASVGNKIKFANCHTTGSGGATKGLWITGNSDYFFSHNCSSRGHSTNGVIVDSGCDYGVYKNFSSGGGDGPRSDGGSRNTWPNYKFDNIIQIDLTLDANNTTKAYNLFKITGVVKIMSLTAVVTTVLSPNHTNCHYDIWDGTVSVDLSDPTGLNLNAAPVGSLIVKNADISLLLDYQSAATGFVSENANYKEPTVDFIVGQKNSTNTYIRFVHTTNDTPSSGVLHIHLEYEPISHYGFLEPV